MTITDTRVSLAVEPHEARHVVYWVESSLDGELEPYGNSGGYTADVFDELQAAIDRHRELFEALGWGKPPAGVSLSLTPEEARGLLAMLLDGDTIGGPGDNVEYFRDQVEKMTVGLKFRDQFEAQGLAMAEEEDGER